MGLTEVQNASAFAGREGGERELGAVEEGKKGKKDCQPSKSYKNSWFMCLDNFIKLNES